VRRQKELLQVPTERLSKEILTIETTSMLEKEAKFMAHVLQCALLASRIRREREAFEKVDEGIVERVEREMEGVLRREGEGWVQMGKVSKVDFEREREEKMENV
jgi:hypothetical protein